MNKNIQGLQKQEKILLYLTKNADN